MGSAPEANAANKALIASVFETIATISGKLEALLSKLPEGGSALDPAVVNVVDRYIYDKNEVAAGVVSLLALKNPKVPYLEAYRELLVACDAEETRRATLSEDERAALPPVTEVAGIFCMISDRGTAPQFERHQALR